MLKRRRLFLLLFLALLLAACAPALPSRPSEDLYTPATPIFGPDDAPDPDIPIAASAEVGAFVWQTDGVYGYRMLRPAGWAMSDSGTSRDFVSPEGAGQPRLALHVVNLRAKEWPQPWGVGGFLRAFEAAGSFEAWVASIANRELGGAERATLPPDLARVAAVFFAQSDGPDGPRIMPFAFKVSEGQPLLLALEGNAGPDEFDALQASGVWDDYLTMLRSLSALPMDAANVTPWAPTATPLPTDPPRTPLPTAPPATAATATAQAEAYATGTPDPRLVIWPSLDLFEQELSRAVLGPRLANRVCEWAMLTGDTNPYYVWAVCMAYSNAPEVARVSVPAVIHVDAYAPAAKDIIKVQVPREGTAWAEDIRALFPKDAQLKIWTRAVDPIIPTMEAHARLRLKWPGLPPLAAAAFEAPNPYCPGVGASASIYSGMPDPSWTLTRLELNRLDELLRELPVGECPPSFDGLVYRGVVVGLGGMGGAGNLWTTNGYVWSGDLGQNDDAICLVDSARSVERFLLSGGVAYTNDPALRELLDGLGGAIPTPMVTPSPTPTVAPGFVWWGDEGLGVQLYLPETWELAVQTPLSRLWQTKVSAAQGEVPQGEVSPELPPFWFTILPPDYDYTDASAYNFWTPDEIAAIWDTQPGNTYVSPHAPDGYNAYTRLADMTVDGFPAAVVNNRAVWEAPRGAQERRVLVQIRGLTVMFGTYYASEDELRAFETALASVKFGGVVLLGGAAAR
jgi:hypothetical protein